MGSVSSWLAQLFEVLSLVGVGDIPAVFGRGDQLGIVGLEAGGGDAVGACFELRYLCAVAGGLLHPGDDLGRDGLSLPVAQEVLAQEVSEFEWLLVLGPTH